MIKQAQKTAYIATNGRKFQDFEQNYILQNVENKLIKQQIILNPDLISDFGVSFLNGKI